MTAVVDSEEVKRFSFLPICPTKQGIKGGNREISITGGMFSADSTTAVRGVDKLIPVDLYLPGCPPRPEAIFDAVIKLRKKVGDEAIGERGKLQQTHRYRTVEHRMTAVEPIVDGRYLRAETQQKALAAAEAVSPLNLAPAEQPETIPAKS